MNRWLFLLLLFAAPKAMAFTYSTTNNQAANTIASMMGLYQTREGALPRTWEELNKSLEPSFKENFPHIRPEERYTFLDHPVPFRWNGKQVRILVMMRSPFRDTTFSSGLIGYTEGLRSRGRYAVFQDSDGKMRSTYIREEEIVKAFAAAGAALPVPDTLGLHPHEKRYWRRQAIQWSILAGGILLALAYWKKRRKQD